MSQELSNQSASDAAAKSIFEPRALGRTLWGVVVIGLSLVWLVMFAISWTHMPDNGASANAPEIVVMATYLPNGKSRLGLTAPDGDLKRHGCDPSSRLCRFVMQHSPTELTVRLAGPSAGMSDQAVLFARAGNDILVTPAEGDANLASLRNTYSTGLIASLAGLVFGGLALLRARI